MDIKRRFTSHDNINRLTQKICEKAGVTNDEQFEKLRVMITKSMREVLNSTDILDKNIDKSKYDKVLQYLNNASLKRACDQINRKPQIKRQGYADSSVNKISPRNGGIGDGIGRCGGRGGDISGCIEGGMGWGGSAGMCDFKSISSGNGQYITAFGEMGDKFVLGGTPDEHSYTNSSRKAATEEIQKRMIEHSRENIIIPGCGGARPQMVDGNNQLPFDPSLLALDGGSRSRNNEQHSGTSVGNTQIDSLLGTGFDVRAQQDFDSLLQPQIPTHGSQQSPQQSPQQQSQQQSQSSQQQYKSPHQQSQQSYQTPQHSSPQDQQMMQQMQQQIQQMTQLLNMLTMSKLETPQSSPQSPQINNLMNKIDDTKLTIAKKFGLDPHALKNMSSDDIGNILKKGSTQGNTQGGMQRGSMGSSQKATHHSSNIKSIQPNIQEHHIQPKNIKHADATHLMRQSSSTKYITITVECDKITDPPYYNDYMVEFDKISNVTSLKIKNYHFLTETKGGGENANIVITCNDSKYTINFPDSHYTINDIVDCLTNSFNESNIPLNVSIDCNKLCINSINTFDMTFTNSFGNYIGFTEQKYEGMNSYTAENTNNLQSKMYYLYISNISKTPFASIDPNGVLTQKFINLNKPVDNLESLILQFRNDDKSLHVFSSDEPHKIQIMIGYVDKHM